MSKKTYVVVLDLYGTLIYVSQETKPYSQLFDDLGLVKGSPERKAARELAFCRTFKSVADFVRHFNLDRTPSLDAYEEAIRREQQSVLAYPETEEVLMSLRPHGVRRVALISNLESQYKEPFFRLKLDGYFDYTVFSCDVGLSKPNPEIYRNVLCRFCAFSPSDFLMVGDNIKADVDGPQSVGMRAVHLDRSGSSQNSIRSLKGIFDYL